MAFVGVTTTKPDKYDRYLADVFYLANEEDGQKMLENGVFLNNVLTKRGWRIGLLRNRVCEADWVGILQGGHLNKFEPRHVCL